MAARSETGDVSEGALGGSAGARWLNRAWRYGPVVAWIAVILYASTGMMSASNTSRIIGPLVRWLYPEISDASLLVVHMVARKCAHFGGYALLGLLAARAFLTSGGAFVSRRWIASSLLLVACVALVDEYNQSFYRSRTGTIWDCLIDFAGGATALAALAWLRQRRERLRGGGVRVARPGGRRVSQTG